MRRTSLVIVCACVVACVAGCRIPSQLHSAERMQRGLVFVLPGIEGQSMLTRSVALGLYDGGIKSAIEVFDWTTRIPGNFYANLTAYERNRRQARRLAERIVAYQQQYPDNPVHLVGHSGGGGLAVMTLEALPPNRRIDMAILLAPALSPEYDMRTALRRTRRGVLNCYSPRDVTLLKIGTTVFGPIDRNRGPAAGAVGFRPPPGLNRAERALYQIRLKQVRWTRRLRKFGADGTHIGWASREFSKTYLAPFIIENENAHVRDAAKARKNRDASSGDLPETQETQRGDHTPEPDEVDDSG